MKKIWFYSLLLSVSIFLSLPVVVLAQNYQTWVADIMGRIATPVWQLFAGITVVMFIVAGILFVTSAGDPGKITTAKQALIWGVVGIVVATLAFSIVNLVSSWV